MTIVPNRVSWTQFQKMQMCNRAWYLKYIKNIDKVDMSDKFNMYLGAMFHKGMESLIRMGDYNEGLLSFLNSYDYPITLANRLEEQSRAIFAHYVDEVSNLLIDYDVLKINGVPCLEYKLEVDNFIGYVDLILQDKLTGEVIFVDYKLSSRLGGKGINGQLPLYIAMAELKPEFMELKLGNYGYWEFNYNYPKPARVLKSGKLSPAKQDTTWDYWLETVPVGYKLDIEFWRARLQDKLKDISDYIKFSKMYVTLDEREYYRKMIGGFGKLVNLTVETEGRNAILTDYICRMCDYSSICENDVSLSNLDGFIGADYSIVDRNN